MAKIDVTIDVSLEEFEDDDMLEYLGGRGYTCLPDWEFEQEIQERSLSEDEKTYLCNKMLHAEPGSIEWRIYHKLKGLWR